MSEIIEGVRGKKTYLLALGTCIYAVLGMWLGYHDADMMIKLIVDSGLAAAIRNGIG